MLGNRNIEVCRLGVHKILGLRVDSTFQKKNHNLKGSFEESK